MARKPGPSPRPAPRSSRGWMTPSLPRRPGSEHSGPQRACLCLTHLGAPDPWHRRGRERVLDESSLMKRHRLVPQESSAGKMACASLKGDPVPGDELFLPRTPSTCPWPSHPPSQPLAQLGTPWHLPFPRGGCPPNMAKPAFSSDSRAARVSACQAPC